MTATAKKPAHSKSVRALRRHTLTVLLTILAVAGVVYAVWFDSDSSTTDEKERRKHNLLEAWRSDDLDEIVLERGEARAKLIARAPDDAGARSWDVEIDGTTHPAEEVVVDDLLRTLDFAIFDRKVPEGSVDRHAFGLDTPALRVTVSMGELVTSVAFGGEAPSPPGARYAEVSDRGVFVVSGQLVEKLSVEPDDLRSRSFVPYFSIELKSIRLDGEGGERHFDRASWKGSRAAGFRFDGKGEHGAVRVKAELLDKVLSSLGSMEARSFLDHARADEALDERVTITLVPNEGEPGVLVLGGACPDDPNQIVAVRRSPTRESICIESQLLDPLVRTATEFVDRSAIGAGLDEIGEVIMTEGDHTVDLARVADGWKMRAPTERAIKGNRGRDFAAALRAVAGDIVTEPTDEMGLSEPRATVRVISSFPTMEGTRHERIEEVAIGATKDDLTYVKRLEDEVVLAVPRDKARDLLPRGVALRDPQVFEQPIQNWSTLRITQGTRVQEITRELTGLLHLEKPASLVSAKLGPDGGFAQTVVQSMGELHAVRWVADADDGTFGLKEPAMVVELVSHPKQGQAAVQQRLMIGHKTGRDYFAKAGDDGAVFVVPKDFYLAASRWMIDRESISISESSLMELEVVTEDGKIGAKRRAGAWGMTGDAETAPGSEVRAAALSAAVSDLRLEGMVAPGPPDAGFGFDKPTASLTLQLRGQDKPVRIQIGVADVFEGTSAYYVRRDGIDATFALARSKVKTILDAAR